MTWSLTINTNERRSPRAFRASRSESTLPNELCRCFKDADLPVFTRPGRAGLVNSLFCHALEQRRRGHPGVLEILHDAGRHDGTLHWLLRCGQSHGQHRLVLQATTEWSIKAVPASNILRPKIGERSDSQKAGTLASLAGQTAFGCWFVVLSCHLHGHLLQLTSP